MLEIIKLELVGRRDTRVKMVDSTLEVNEFLLQSRYYIPFRTNIFGKCVDTTNPPAIG